MEALAAFGIACNVMQTIKFSFEIVDACKKVFRDGSADPGLLHLTSRSVNIFSDLSCPLEQFEPRGVDEDQLAHIARDCLRAGHDLISAVTKIAKPKAQGKLLLSFRSGIRAKVSEGKIKKLEARLQAHQRILELHLLVRVCNQQTAVLLQHDAAFRDLPGTLRAFVEASARGRRDIESLLSKHTTSIQRLVRAETHQSRQAVATIITEESFKTREGLLEVARGAYAEPPLWKKRQQLLQSLRYSAMNERLTQIADNHHDTYQWILQGIRPWLDENGPANAGHPGSHHLHPDCSHAIRFPNVTWSCFPCWLESPSNNVYWVQGKAGSGKSTLMKFLLSQRGDGLIGSNGIVLSHFLWAAGTPLQKSIRGILLNLVHQFLSQQENILDSIIGNHGPARFSFQDAHDWNEAELRHIIKTWFPQTKAPILILLDGLDELDSTNHKGNPTPFHLLSLLDEFTSIPNVHLCVSSRPEPELELYFRESPILRLQDVTSHDMKLFAESQLLKPGMGLGPTKESQDLIEGLCDKADGVFLWLVRAVGSLARGLARGDSILELQQRVKQLPSGLYPLYQDMWTRLSGDEVIYQEEAARYFNMVREWSLLTEDWDCGHIEVFHVFMACNPSKAEAVLEDFEALSAEDIPWECTTMAKRITTRTAGLLELGPDGNLLGFAHLSALEFLEKTMEGQQLLGHDVTNPETRYVNLVYAFLAGICLQVTGKREVTAYSHTTQLSVLNVIYRAWIRGEIPEKTAVKALMACKRLHDTGLWGRPPLGDDLTREIYNTLDFYALCASFGFPDILSKNIHTETLSSRARRYLYTAACLDPNEMQDVDFSGKGAVVSNLLGQRTTRDLEDLSTSLPLALFATLNIYVGGRHWPHHPNTPTLPDLVKQYLHTSGSISLEARFAFTLQRAPDDEDDFWRPNISCIGSMETMYTRRSSTWLTLEMDIATMMRLCLQAMVACPQAESRQGIQALKNALDDLSAAGLGRHLKPLAFGFPMTNLASGSLVGEKNGMPLAMERLEDAKAALGCIEGLRLCPSQAQGAGGDLREFLVPGLRKCLIRAAASARVVDEMELSKAKRLPLQDAIFELMTKAPEIPTRWEGGAAKDRNP